MQHQARRRAIPHLADQNAVCAGIRGDDGFGRHRIAQRGEHLMRSPAVWDGKAGFQRGAGRTRLPIRPTWRRIMTQGRERKRKIADQRDVRAVHAMTARARRDVDHGLIGAKHIAPADPHLDRVIAQQENGIRRRDQRHQDAVGLWRQPRAPKAQRVRLGHQALALVGGDQGNVVGPAKGGKRGACGFVHRIHTGNRQRAPCARQGITRRGQVCRGGQAGPGHPWAGRGLGRCGLGHRNRNINMHRPRLARRGKGNRLGHARSDRPGGKAEAALDHGAQQCRMVEHLMRVGFRLGGIDASRQKDQRNPVLHGIGDHVHGISDPRPQGRDQHRKRTRHVPQPFGHETAAVLVLYQHKAQTGRIQPLHQGQHLAPRNAKGMCCPGLCQGCPDDLRAGLCHASSSPPITPLAASADRSAGPSPRCRANTAPVSAPKAGGALP